jgi:hypothetical protein
MGSGDAGDEYIYSPPTNDSFHSPRLVSIRVFRHKLVQTLEMEYALKVPAQLSWDRKSRLQKMVEIPVTSRVSLIHGGERIDIHTEADHLLQSSLHRRLAAVDPAYQ